jgi:hypothetical protein
MTVPKPWNQHNAVFIGNRAGRHATQNRYRRLPQPIELTDFLDSLSERLPGVYFLPVTIVM